MNFINCSIFSKIYICNALLRAHTNLDCGVLRFWRRWLFISWNIVLGIFFLKFCYGIYLIMIFVVEHLAVSISDLSVCSQSKVKVRPPTFGCWAICPLAHAINLQPRLWLRTHRKVQLGRLHNSIKNYIICHT